MFGVDADDGTVRVHRPETSSCDSARVGSVSLAAPPDRYEFSAAWLARALCPFALHPAAYKRSCVWVRANATPRRVMSSARCSAAACHVTPRGGPGEVFELWNRLTYLERGRDPESAAGPVRGGGGRSLRCTDPNTSPGAVVDAAVGVWAWLASRAPESLTSLQASGRGWRAASLSSSGIALPSSQV